MIILGLLLNSGISAINTIFIHGAGVNECSKGNPNDYLSCPTACLNGVYSQADLAGEPYTHVCYNPFVTSNSWNDYTSGITQLWRALEAHCKVSDGKTCQIICHSMGCAITEWFMDHYNDNRRYAIYPVGSLGSAAGGSPLATVANILDTLVHTNIFRTFLGSIFGLDPTDMATLQGKPYGQIIDPLIDPTSARNPNVVNHNDMNSATVYMTAGYGIWRLLNEPKVQNHLGALAYISLWYDNIILGVGSNDGLVSFASAFMRSTDGYYLDSGKVSDRYVGHYVRPTYPNLTYPDNWRGLDYDHMEIGAYGVPNNYRYATPIWVKYPWQN